MCFKTPIQQGVVCNQSAKFVFNRIYYLNNLSYEKQEHTIWNLFIIPFCH